MSFKARLALVHPFETWPVMEVADEQRYWAGLMLLKTAYFRVVGIAAEDDIASHLRTAR